MPATPQHLLRHLRRLASGPAPGPASDAHLLERFIRRRDEDSFAALVGRHGPMVRGVCRRLLADAHTAEDCFQATFLVLARRDASVRPREALAAWLYGVARRVALKARSASARRPARPLPSGGLAPADPRPDPLDQLTARELLSALEEEVARLPEVHRLPVILCCLEGLCQEEAARRLGWTHGSVKGRLERGRARLRARLAKRGLSLPAVLAAACAGHAVTAGGAAAVPLARAALAFAAGQTETTPAASSPQAALLARAALASGRKVLPALALAGCLLAAGVGALLCQGQAADPGRAPRPAAVKPAAGDAAPAPGLGRPGRVDHDPEKPAAGGDAPAPAVKIHVAEAPGDEDPLPPGAVRRLGSLRFRHGHGWGATDVLFAPDGKTLVSVGAGEVRLWQTASGKEIPRPAGLAKERALCAALSPDGTSLALGGDSGDIRLREVATGKELRRLPGKEGQVLALAYAPDGKFLAAATHFANTVCVYRAATGELLWQAKTHQPGCLTFSPDGKYVTAQTGPGRVDLFDAATGRPAGAVHYPGQIQDAAFSPDGKLLAAGDDLGGVSLWELPSGKLVKRLGGRLGSVRPAARYVAFSVDGKLLACSGNALQLWDVESGQERPALQGASGRFGRAVFAPDGKTLAAAGAGVVRLWDVASGRRLRQSGGHEDQVFRVFFSRDGRVVASESSHSMASADNTLRLWETATGRELQRVALVGGDYYLSDLGRLVVGDFGRGAVRLLDLVTGRELRRFPTLREGGFFHAFSPDGRFLALGTMSGVVALWDLAEGREAWVLGGHQGHVLGLAFSPDGKVVSGGHERAVRLGEAPKDHARLGEVVANGHERWRAAVPALPVSLAVSPRGDVVAAGLSDNTIRAWDLATGREVLRVKDNGQGTSALAYSPDGKVLASSGMRGEVHLLDAATGRELAVLRGHRGAVRALAFAPDGRLLASASDDTTVLLWDVKGRAGKAPPPRAPVAGGLEALWADLSADDGFRACLAVHKLSAISGAVRFLTGKLRPLAAADPRLTRLVRDLDATRFPAREQAARELEELGELVEPALRQALTAKPTLEARRRIEKLLAKLDAEPPSPARLRPLRALHALERIGTPEARAALQELARGVPEARVAREARGVLQQLDRRQGKIP
jgi:RNA polymerase sigma factor (sigma-70 family)